METARRTTIATLLLALAIVAFATAAVTLVNITEWTVMAQGSPVVKVAGSDVGNKPGSYVNVTSYIARDGTNRTAISVIGFKGDPTNYTSVLKICNKNFTGPVTVKLVYKGLLSPQQWPSDVTYVKLFNSTNNNILLNLPTNPPGTEVTIGRIGPGRCSSDIGVSVLVSANAPTKTELVTFEVDVVSTG